MTQRKAQAGTGRRGLEIDVGDSFGLAVEVPIGRRITDRHGGGVGNLLVLAVQQGARADENIGRDGVGAGGLIQRECATADGGIAGVGVGLGAAKDLGGGAHLGERQLAAAAAVFDHAVEGAAAVVAAHSERHCLRSRGAGDSAEDCIRGARGGRVARQGVDGLVDPFHIDSAKVTARARGANLEIVRRINRVGDHEFQNATVIHRRGANIGAGDIEEQTTNTVVTADFHSGAVVNNGAVHIDDAAVVDLEEQRAVVGGGQTAPGDAVRKVEHRARTGRSQTDFRAVGGGDVERGVQSIVPTDGLEAVVVNIHNAPARDGDGLVQGDAAADIKLAAVGDGAAVVDDGAADRGAEGGGIGDAHHAGVDDSRAVIGVGAIQVHRADAVLGEAGRPANRRIDGVGGRAVADGHRVREHRAGTDDGGIRHQGVIKRHGAVGAEKGRDDRQPVFVHGVVPVPGDKALPSQRSGQSRGQGRIIRVSAAVADHQRDVGGGHIEQDIRVNAERQREDARAVRRGHRHQGVGSRSHRAGEEVQHDIVRAGHADRADDRRPVVRGRGQVIIRGAAVQGQVIAQGQRAHVSVTARSQDRARRHDHIAANDAATAEGCARRRRHGVCARAAGAHGVHQQGAAQHFRGAAVGVGPAQTHRAALRHADPGIGIGIRQTVLIGIQVRMVTELVDGDARQVRVGRGAIGYAAVIGNLGFKVRAAGDRAGEFHRAARRRDQRDIVDDQEFI